MKRFFVGAIAVAACAYAYACDSSPESHVYVAALYDGVSCFASSASLGYVDTPDGNLDCAPTCLIATTSAGQTLTYVSTMCGPYPTALDSSQTDPSCAGAIAAWANQIANGGLPGACVTPGEDAGDDAAGGDSGEDSAGEGDGEVDANDDGGLTDAPVGG